MLGVCILDLPSVDQREVSRPGPWPGPCPGPWPAGVLTEVVK